MNIPKLFEILKCFYEQLKKEQSSHFFPKTIDFISCGKFAIFLSPFLRVFEFYIKNIENLIFFENFQTFLLKTKIWLLFEISLFLSEILNI